MMAAQTELTEADLRSIQRFQEEVQKAAASTKKDMELRADFRIQIWFRSTRSRTRPIQYSLSFWSSGKRLHGGGDEKMFVCFRNRGAPKIKPFEVAARRGGSFTAEPSERGCGGIIDGSLVLPDNTHICPHCSTRHKAEHLGDVVFYATSARKCATVLAHWWTKFKGNADLYAKYSSTDIRYQTALGTQGILAARASKGAVIYPLKNIMKDTSAGKDIVQAFEDFILA